MQKMGLFFILQSARDTGFQRFKRGVAAKQIAQRNTAVAKQAQVQLAQRRHAQAIAAGAEVFGVRHDKADFAEIILVAKHQRRAIRAPARLAIAGADLIIIGPGSFLTSLMPLLLLEDLTQALRRTRAPMIYLDNLGRELSVAAANMTLARKVHMMEQAIGREKVIDGVIIGPATAAENLAERVILQRPLAAEDEPHHHDRALLRQALDLALQSLG